MAPPWLATALALQRAEPAVLRPLLAGRRFGLVCTNDRAADALAFREAAERLGAHVAHVVPPPESAGDDGATTALRRTAVLLGRLYDALECQGLPEGAVRRLAHEAGIPVFDGAATAGHPSAGLAERLDPTLPLPHRRRCVLQAVLLQTLGG